MRLEDDSEPLVRLQRREQAGCGGDPLAALGPFGRPRPLAGEPLDAVAVAVTDQGPLPRSPHREGLAAGHDLHPGDQVAGRAGRRLGEQDLDRPLVGIVGVVGAQRVAPSRAPERRAACR